MPATCFEGNCLAYACCLRLHLVVFLIVTLNGLERDISGAVSNVLKQTESHLAYTFVDDILECVHISQGKSARTVQRHKQARRHLEAQGFLSLLDFFKHMDKKAQQQEPSKLEPMESSMAVKDGGNDYNPENEVEEVSASVVASL